MFFCESDLTNYKAIEHLTPVSRGGDNEKYNLVYSCKSCNSKKTTADFRGVRIKYKEYLLAIKVGKYFYCIFKMNGSDYGIRKSI